MNETWEIVLLIAWALAWCAIAGYWRARARDLERRLALVARLRREGR